MLRALLSDDRPGSPLLSLILIAIFVTLALAPLLFDGSRALDTAARICIFIVLVASFDLLLGYAGIVSFAHTVFFGLGAYGVALTTQTMGRGWEALWAGTAAGAAAAAVLALMIGLVSLRVREIHFAMITFAVASVAAVLVSQSSGITGGEDGMSLQIPASLTAAATYGVVPSWSVSVPAQIADLLGVSPGVDGTTRLTLGGQRISGTTASYFLVFGVALVLFLVMLRVVNSPFGRALRAIRENGMRAEAIGYPVVRYRIAVSVLSAVIASIAGALFAIWLRHVGPDSVLSFEIMIQVLLMVVIGGMGTLWGAVLGTVLLILAQDHLRALMGLAADAAADLPLLPDLFDPDRWMLWLGVLLVLSVCFFPSGIVGRLRRRI